ncbi:MarR family transcriptional regulator [Shimia sp.]|uniref:MarR family winged helix-turn-helix transcriptional regulator n=1 Tax=Shimia sp. TaxID=1954381 RepID=UPI00329774DD
MKNPYFSFLTEIGIIAQLSRTMLEKRLPDGVSAPMFGVLNHLARLGGGQTPLQIARAFQVAKSSMTNTLAGLERRGLIEMRPNPKDGRSKGVWLTDKGATLREAAIQQVAPDLKGLAEAFPAGYVDEITPRLSEIRAWLDAARDADNSAE